MTTIAHLVHSLPRRVRMRAPALVGHREACRRVAEKLLELDPSCEKIDIRPVTGSIIVETEDGSIDAEAICDLLEQLVAEERDEKGHPLTAVRPDSLPGPTRVARAVAHAFSEINGDVRVALDHRADLGTLLPVVFFSLGLVEIGVTRKLPVPAWFNLLWWSLRSFMTFNVGAVEEQSKVVAAERAAGSGLNGASSPGAGEGAGPEDG
jgi:hypothetical protein